MSRATAIAGAVAVLLVVGLLGLSALRGQRAGAHPYQEAIAARRGMLAGGSRLPTMARAAAIAHTAQAPQLILAGSAEQTNQIQRALDELDTIRKRSQLGPLDTAVLAVNVGPDTQTLQSALDDENSLHVSLGLPAIVVVELRTAAGATDHARWLAQRAVADENPLRVSLGLSEVTVPD